MDKSQKNAILFLCIIIHTLNAVNSAGRKCRDRSSCASCTANDSGCQWCQLQAGAVGGFCGTRSKIGRTCDGEIFVGGDQFKEVASVKCSTVGTYECGQCTCDEGYYGNYCECNVHTSSDETCKMSPQSEPCEGRGSCICGMCDCDPIGPNTPQRHSGQFCECDDYSCDYFDNMLCGGPEHGVCSCGQCVCRPEWDGPACACLVSQDPCLASNKQVCNGHGQCLCGACACEGLYMGPTCEDHPYNY